ncbi:MAG: ABC transporter ATP-binding protein [Mycoplasmataceae bacterium]|nr:ABC transporter ATP-binding protein [Mycoplasmataceae bacterium]
MKTNIANYVAPKYHPLSKRKFFKKLETSFLHANFFEKNIGDFLKRLKTDQFPKDQKILINLSNISKQFSVYKSKPNVLFENINIKIKRGDIISLVGANGVGKSTLLDILVDYLRPNTGEVIYDLEYHWSPTERIGISYQKNILLSSLSVWDYISFTHRLYKSTTTMDDLVIFCYAFGIEKFIKMRVSKLSGGQQQRLNAMLSLFHNPEIVLFDELCNNLDVSIKQKIISFIKNYFRIKNITAIIISHDVYEIKNVANRIIVIKDKKIANDVKVKTLLSHSAKGIEHLIAESV